MPSGLKSAALVAPRLASSRPLPAGRRCHKRRHTCAARSSARARHPPAIMERLGHPSVTVTIDTYGHLFPALDEALSDGLERTYRPFAPTGTKLLVVQIWCSL
jgi:integrase